jgi:hypothetical protein
MRKNKRLILIVGFLVLFIALSNFYSYLYIGLLDGGISKQYHFETYDGKHKFTTMPGKGSDVLQMERKFKTFCIENLEYQGTDIYRTFNRNLLKYWRWYEYFTHPRYKYKYKKPSKNSVDHFRIGTKVK